MKRRPLIAVCGDTRLDITNEKYQLAEVLGKKLIDSGYRIVTGGLGGVMEAVSSGARKSDSYKEGDIVGILPGTDPSESNEYIDISIATDLDYARNLIVSNSDAVVAIGGGAGTLSEIALAWAMKRLIIAYEVDGWSGKLANTRIDHRNRYEDIEDDMVYGVKTSDEVLDLLSRLLPKYNKRHHGARNKKIS
jgi:uncharacterized protein (TIGR00725 family)